MMMMMEEQFKTVQRLFVYLVPDEMFDDDAGSHNVGYSATNTVVNRTLDDGCKISECFLFHKNKDY